MKKQLLVLVVLFGLLLSAIPALASVKKVVKKPAPKPAPKKVIVRATVEDVRLQADLQRSQQKQTKMSYKVQAALVASKTLLKKTQNAHAVVKKNIK